MDNYFRMEIFPKSRFFFKSIEKGNIEFNFEEKQVFLIVDNETIEFKENPNYHRIWIHIENNGDFGLFDKNNHLSPEYFNVCHNLFGYLKRICDILSLATDSHINYFSFRLLEYETLVMGLPSDSKKPTFSANSFKVFLEEYNFLNSDLLNNIILKIEKHKHKDRIFSALHLNRLSKIKCTTAISEAVADGVSSLEALYLNEKDKKRSGIDHEIINKEIGNNLEAVFYQFLKKWGSPKEITEIVENLKPYEIRSKYLHRGMSIEQYQDSLIRMFISREDKDKYEMFFKIVFDCILKFVLEF